VLLSNLVSTVKVAKKLTKTLLWTDSTVVLKWLASFPGRWKTFVANRVSEIQGAFPVDNWRHVKCEDNPTDCASRDISAGELADHHLWWEGPAWLRGRELPFFIHKTDMEADRNEDRNTAELTHPTTVDKSLVNEFSTLQKLKLSTAYSLRFLKNVRSKPEDRVSGGTSLLLNMTKPCYAWYS